MNQWVFAAASAIITGFALSIQFPFPDQMLLPQLTYYHDPRLYAWLRYSWIVMMYTTSALVYARVASWVCVYVDSPKRLRIGKLPPFPRPRDADPLYLVLGETHYQREMEPSENPQWLKMPERGLFTGIAAFGATGSGKTASVLRPAIEQIFYWRRKDQARKPAGIVLEVKGNFCYQVRDVLRSVGRGDDYVELNFSGSYRYNPLQGEQDAFALAYSVASIITQLYGSGKDPFWQQAYTNMMKFFIILHKSVDEYCAFLDVYRSMIDPVAVRGKIAEGDGLFHALTTPKTWILVDKAVSKTWRHELTLFDWIDNGDGQIRGEMDAELQALLDEEQIPWRIEVDPQPGLSKELALRKAQFEAFKRWYQNIWLAMDARLQTSIIEGLEVVLSLFDTQPELQELFCPPRECYDPIKNADEKYGRPLPQMRDLIESGKVLALNFPVAVNPAISKLVAVLIKQEFQRVMLMRISRMAQHPDKVYREVVFLCDEYHMLATVGHSNPNGDEKFFALSRESKTIPIVATQSFSSLRETLGNDGCMALLQCFRTKLFLTINDRFTAEESSKVCGRTDELIPSYAITESGNDARISAVSGNLVSDKSGVSLNTNYGTQKLPTFETKVFAELPNAVCVAFVYDGEDAHPPQLLYLKPYFLPVQQTWFEQRRQRRTVKQEPQLR